MVERLSECCLAHVLSLTSPSDACRAAAVSTTFSLAAESDLVWTKFLPRDYQAILDRADDGHGRGYSSKRELFFRLCEKPIIMDGNKMSFGLDKFTGKKWFMLSARALTIVGAENPKNWTWYQEPDSRFSEVARLLEGLWLEIGGEIESKLLSHQTTYIAYLVFRLQSTCGLFHPPQKTLVKVGDQLFRLKVRLRPTFPHRNRMTGGILRFRPPRVQIEEEKFEPGIRLSQPRADGWMEVELGEFYNMNGEDGQVKISLTEVEGVIVKRGLIVQGIEIRPKRQCK